MKQRFTTLDIFRGILASFIVLVHMSFFSDTLVLNNPFMQGTDLFVDFFFILSGFIIRYNYSEITNLQTLVISVKSKICS
ncbi:peptidoglycan/LPS O-acetylase OafA/YrhL [Siphonobacter sp. SORGH_AS 1065]|nr:peptidoglycan/LPS O-acetylase OafA/YrhL [Siphonobacter sp. SORGH_AS_1065]